VSLPTAGPWTRADTRLLVVVVALAVTTWLPRFRGPIDLRYDAGVYYTLGTSLAQGKGYRLLNEPGAIQAIQYPPLLPVFAAIHERLLGSSDPVKVGHWLRISAFLLFVGYAAAVYGMSRRFLTRGYAFLVAAMCAVHTQTVFMSDSFAADVPYGFVSTLFFLVGGGFGAGLLAVASYAIRSAGVALLGAWIGESVLRIRLRQAALRAAVAIVALGTWQVYTSGVKHSPEYQQPAYAYQRAGYQFYNVGYLENMAYKDPFRPELGQASSRDLVKRVLVNLGELPMGLGEGVSVHRGWWRSEVEKLNQKVPAIHAPKWLADVAIIILCLLVIAGTVLLAWHGYWIIGLYLVGALLLMALTPWPGQFIRYLVPLTPFLTLALVYALAAASAWAAQTAHWVWRSARLCLLGAVSVILIQHCYALYKTYTKYLHPAVFVDAAGKRHDYRLLFHDRTWQLHDDALDWLARRAKPGEIVATSAPHWAYLKTGLPSVMPPYVPDGAEADRLISAVPVTYLIVDRLEFVDIGRRYTTPIVAHAPDQWRLIYFVNDTGPRIYQREVSAVPASKVAASRGAK